MLIYTDGLLVDDLFLTAKVIKLKPLTVILKSFQKLIFEGADKCQNSISFQVQLDEMLLYFEIFRQQSSWNSA